MPLVEVVLTDTIDQFRQKTNLAIDLLNTLSDSGTVLAIETPAAGEILVYDGTAFQNVVMSGDVAINSSGVTTIVSGGDLITTGRMAFAGARTSVY